MLIRAEVSQHHSWVPSSGYIVFKCGDQEHTPSPGETVSFSVMDTNHTNMKIEVRHKNMLLRDSVIGCASGEVSL